MVRNIFILLASGLIISAFSYKSKPVSSAPPVPQNDSTGCMQTSVFDYNSPAFCFESARDTVYNAIFNKQQTLNRNVFDYALKGYIYLLKQGVQMKKDTMTVIDYSLSANVKRLWVLDLKNNKVLFHELVAHGRNSGNEFAKNFSNISNSFKSSLGFFLTGDIYSGKHETSIKLFGIENRFNSNAFERGIVIHGADYVSESFINQNQRLGRSQGCPAVSENVIGNISKVISNKSCLFAYYPNKVYLKTSKLLKGI